MVSKQKESIEQEVAIAVASGTINGHLVVPPQANGIVIFAHGTGSSRLSPRNRYVADLLNKAELATLLMDLLTQEEEQVDMFTAHLRFNIDFLSRRLIEVTRWVAENEGTKMLRLAYFGSSTGAAAALQAAVQWPGTIAALVSRGGRPDLAAEILTQVATPTLLIVGGDDEVVLDLNRGAYEKLKCPRQLTVIRGATHLFEEPGKLREAAEHAKHWFVQYLS